MTYLTRAVLLGAIALGLAGTAAAEPGGHKRGEHLKRMLQEADTNKDSAVSKAEIAAHRATIFAEIDANKDGFADDAEIAAHARAKMEERLNKMAERRKAMEGGPADRLDANKDGKLSAAEFTSAPPWFDKVDANADGKITREEMKAMRDRRGQ